MKKIVCLAVSLTAFTGFAQNNKSVEFTKKLNYKIEITNSEDNSLSEDFSNINYDHYLDKNNKESLLSFYYNDAAAASYGGSESNFFVSKNWMIPLSVSGISKAVNYTQYGAFKILNEGQSVTKLDRKGTIGGTNCQYYAILRDIDNKESYDYCFCIDESNKINNAESIFPDSKLKGLILSVEFREDQNYRLVYRSAENTNLNLNLDTEKMLADIEEYREEYRKEMQDYTVATDSVASIDWEAYDLATAYESTNTIYVDPLYTYGNLDFESYGLYNYVYPVYGVTSNLLYNTNEYSTEDAKYSREQVLKFFKKSTKNLVKELSSSKLITSDEKKELKDFFASKIKEAEAFKPGAPSEASDDYAYVIDDVAMAAAEAVAYADYDYYTKYEPEYKDMKISDISLAYDILDDEELKKNAPDYCDELHSKIPDFQNKELKIHVHNFAGQICDLYLYNNGGYVDYFGTINSMRKSLLEIEKLRSSLSKKDNELLLKFINSLD